MDPNSLWRKNEWCTGGAYYFAEGQSLKFDPPCYIQRYGTVFNVIKDELNQKPGKTVVEFGCAELGFFRQLKLMKFLRKVILVDIDEDLLKNCYHNASPELFDYVGLRTSPFDVQVMAGSVHQYDRSLEGADVVVAIELIEHLHQDVLDQVPCNVFENIRPELAIITTPNADFNEAIPNFPGRRHDDHKFEWSRKEFTQWAIGVTETYSDYSVLLYGIGQGPVGTEHLGCCSQMAVFRLKPGAEQKPKAESESEQNYTLVKEYNYPFDKRTTEDKIYGEVNSMLYLLTDGFDPDITEVPLEKFLKYLEGLCSDVQTLKQVLQTFGCIICGTDASPALVVDSRESSEEEEENDSDDEQHLGLACSNQTDDSCYRHVDEEDWT